MLLSWTDRKLFCSVLSMLSPSGSFVPLRSARQHGRLLRENRLTGALPANLTQMSALRMLYAAIAILYLLLLSIRAPLFAGT